MKKNKVKTFLLITGNNWPSNDEAVKPVPLSSSAPQVQPPNQLPKNSHKFHSYPIFPLKKLSQILFFTSPRE